MGDRLYLAVSVKHTEYKWKFGMPCVLWGHRTKDTEPRCYGGYTEYPDHAELYSIEEWREKYGSCEWMKTDEPVRMEIGFCRKWKKFDTVLVPYSNYSMYCNCAGLPLKEIEAT